MACVGGGRYDNVVFGEVLCKTFDNCACGVDLADADGVYPDAFFFVVFSMDTTKAIFEAFAITFMSDASIDSDRAKED
jgi:hypothetical protein